jgi:hypothetical protein
MQLKTAARFEFQPELEHRQTGGLDLDNSASGRSDCCFPQRREYPFRAQRYPPQANIGRTGGNVSDGYDQRLAGAAGWSSGAIGARVGLARDHVS